VFRENNDHNQQSLLDSTQWMNPRIREKLKKSWAPIFYEHVFCRIDERPFSVLYAEKGAPNFPVNILLSLEYIKAMKSYSDLELLDAFYFDYMVNYALGIKTLGELNLAERTLNYFRERIYQYCLENPDAEDLLFSQFTRLVESFATHAGIDTGQQRSDTTLFMSNIKKAGRMSLAYDVLIKAIKAIPEDKRTEDLSSVLKPDFKTDTLYRAKAQEADSRLEQLLNLCREALNILIDLPGTKALEEIRITKRFIEEQSIIDADTGKLIAKPKKEISSGSLQSAYDEDATYRIKGDVRQSGYVLELSETCNKDNPFQLLTDYAVEPNNTSDVEILKERLEVIRENTGCTDMYVDGGFHSPDIHTTAKENGIKVHLTNMSGTTPKKRIPATDFEIDTETYIIIKCPMGHVPTRVGLNKKRDHTSAHFQHQTCEGCELRNQCHSRTQKRDNVVRIPIKAVKAGMERITLKTEQKENTSLRAGIEGSNSALKRTGLKKLPVRGKTKSTMVCGFMVAAQNIKRFIKYLQGGYKPKSQNPPPHATTLPVLG
jgi:hypothetical protein